jgi:Xaa-Pro aminopeptidase
MYKLDKLTFIRTEMNKQGISACIIPSSDSHLSEYPASHWKLREYLSGFTGSNGTLVITQKKACLWTDSRYFLQAEKELNSELFILQREGERETPTIINWLSNHVKNGDTIGVDGSVFAASTLLEWEAILGKQQINLNPNFRSELTKNLPSISTQKAFLLDTKHCGETAQSKIKRICNSTECDLVLLTALDDIAWTFNIRGKDVDFNPMTIAYGCVGRDESFLFIDNAKLNESVIKQLKESKITPLPYTHIKEFIHQVNQSKQTISVDGTKTNYTIYNLIDESLHRDEPSIATNFKAQKNAIEIENIRNAMKKDGAALCNALSQIEERVRSGDYPTEYEVGEILHENRQLSTDFYCDSFAPIVGFGKNGAIVHYSAKKEDSKEITRDNLLLIDSGGNYLCGTTDITRTFCFGEATAQQKQDYTLVLKGHIALARQSFPSGTCGEQLDCLARQFLWNNDLNYGHGTGHGIGYFLCVHEGPQTIRPQGKGIILKPGMILSDEPGLYRTNEYGIRIENVVVVKPKTSDTACDFLEFETLTLFPYESKLFDFNLLTTEELQWIDNYHQRVFNEISPFLSNPKSYEWLKNKTKSTLF